MSIRIKRNGVWVDVKADQNLDPTLSIEGIAADAKAVGDRIDDLPLAVYELNDGSQYTEILGLRPARNIKMVNNTETNMIQIAIELSDGEVVYYYLKLNNNGYPIAVETNNVECPIEWSGF